jgi:hypothetical protein
MTSIGWTTVSGETVGSHMFTFPAQKTQGTALLPNPELLARMFCHFVVSALPNEALPELVDELGDLRSEYLKPMREAGTLLTSPTKLKAKFGRSVGRPEIQLDKE